MILIIVAAWLGLLALLVNLKILKGWLLWMKLSPFAIFLLGEVFLLIPMGSGAPSGPAVVVKHTIQIVPSVSGVVIDVSAEGGVSLQKGDVLFTIDPVPYQTEVDRLEAALKEAQLAASMLPANLAEADAAVKQSEAALVASRSQVESLRASLKAADASVAEHQAQLDLAESDYERSRKLIASQATTQADLETRERNLAAAQASFEQAKSLRKRDQLALDSQIGGVNTSIIQAEALMQAAQARRARAKLQLESNIDGENVDVAQIRAQLELARAELSWTFVQAPTDGFVTIVSLRPGAVVVADKSQVMSFIDETRQVIAAQIDQINLRHIEVGQSAEVIFKHYPGKVFDAEVVRVVRAAPSGQIAPSGLALEAFEIEAEPFWVVLELKDKLVSLPPGAAGTVAVYTNKFKMSHIFRKIILRMENWLNFVRAT
jgi:multidrug resistance efflux pump